MKNCFDANSYPVRHWKTSQDIAVKLPHNFDEYHSNLGGHTRKNIAYYSGRLRRAYGDVAFHVTVGPEIEPSTIGRILDMNRLRMKNKNIQSGFDSSLEKKIVEFCRHYGLVSTLSLQGKVAAGAICYEVGNQAYLEIIAHHPDFDKDRVGQICLYLTVKHMIDKGRDSFHMLWGENEYKYRFLGVKQELCFFSVYRSYAAKAADIPRLARHTCSYIVRQLDYLARKYLKTRRR
jgi:hypothetical protein